MKSLEEERTFDIPNSDIKEAVEGSRFDIAFLEDFGESENTHFSSVIKEVEGEDGNTYLVKIRPPLFILNGLISNMSRLFLGLKNPKVIDNKEWAKREVEHLREIYPDMDVGHTPYENAFVMEKIDGEVACDILSSEDIEFEHKKKVITGMSEALRTLHKKDRFHGEPNTQNCLVDEEFDIYWIDFETEYDERLSSSEKRARDLEQLALSVLGAFEENKETGLDDKEIVDMIFKAYGDENTISLIKKDPSIPFVGPHRLPQFSYSSLLRFYEAQMNVLDYLDEDE